MPNTIFTVPTSPISGSLPNHSITNNINNTMMSGQSYYYSNTTAPLTTGPITTGPITTGNTNGCITATDMILGGVSVGETLKKIQDRLSILVPDPSKLENYAALKAAYENYLLLEKLCQES